MARDQHLKLYALTPRIDKTPQVVQDYDWCLIGRLFSHFSLCGTHQERQSSNAIRLPT